MIPFPLRLRPKSHLGLAPDTVGAPPQTLFGGSAQTPLGRCPKPRLGAPPEYRGSAPDPVGATMQSFSAFSCSNTEIAAYHWFRGFGLIFGSDMKLIHPSYCIVREALIKNPLRNVSALLIVTIPRSPLISDSGGSGSYSGLIRN